MVGINFFTSRLLQLDVGWSFIPERGTCGVEILMVLCVAVCYCLRKMSTWHQHLRLLKAATVGAFQIAAADSCYDRNYE